MGRGSSLRRVTGRVRRLGGRVRRFAGKVRRAVPAELNAAWRRMPVRSHVVFYESFSANGALCNPEAIFRALIDDPEFSRLHHVWTLNDPAAHPRITDEFRGHRRVRFVRHRSAAYFRALATAGYLVNNATFPPEFGKRPGQVYLNTWHGTPLKAMGYGIPNGALGTRNVVRNFLAADYLVSSGPFMTEQMYAVDYRLRNIFRGRIIEAGQPRTDRSLAPGAREEAVSAFEATGLRAQGRKVFVYAPTWKGASFYRPEDSSEDIRQVLDTLQDALGPHWLAVAKVHQSVYAASVRSGNLTGRLVDNDIPTNVVLAGADALMTDYSSIFFDFLCLDRPIYFYLADADHYSSTRGLYESVESLPGSKAATLEELASLARRLASGEPEPTEDVRARQEWRDKYAPKDDGAATQRVVDVVFRGQADPGLIDISRDHRQRVLIYLGSMKSMGITTSGLNLLANIDHERFDVSAVYTYTVKSDPMRNIRAIDRRVRHLPRMGAMNGSKLTHLKRERLIERGIPAQTRHQSEIPVAQLFHDEWVRCFGDAEFDHIIDFSGYGAYWDCILLQGRGAKHSIWLHNDLYADARRETNGVRHLYNRLHSVFTTYRFFDHLVSVSAALSKVNSANLADYAPADRFTFAANTIDFERILRMAEPPAVPELAAEGGALASDGSDTADVETAEAAEAAEAAALDIEAGEIVEAEEAGDGLTEQVTTWSWRKAAPGVVTFVTVGRLSPEKNQERLIRAFARVHADHPDSRLIILGGGPIIGRLRALIKELGMTGRIQLAGFLSNPFRVLAHCDCFVLPSDHEGQPMVILEALTLGLPVIATQFSSVDGAIPPGCGIVVPRSVDGVEYGLREFLAGRLPKPSFDPVAYNRQAMDEFYSAIGAHPAD